MSHLALLAASVNGEALGLAVASAVGLGAVVAFLASRAGTQRARATALRTAAVLTPAQLASQAAGGPVLCEVPGAAAPGPAGPVTAPLSGTPCVWYHVRVSERRQYGGSSAFLRLGRGRRAGLYGAAFEPIREESSAAPFALVDGNASALVRPQGMVADFVFPAGVPTDGVPAPRTVYRYEPLQRNQVADLAASVLLPSRDYVIGHLYEEWCVTEGMPVFVLGQARADRGSVEVSQPADGPFVLSVTPPQQQLATASYATRMQYSVLAITLVGTLATLAVVYTVAR
jgi:E3 Ubiquitin ligase